ncbi:NTP transferase domain-containing protein [Aestuariispira insulae]|nr:molybdopterin-binding/glycosyltransferase family 2 protein [Aestuariispira insulae]
MDFAKKTIANIRPGAILAHSLALEGRRLKKGHILSETDLSLIRQSGVASLVVAELQDEDSHEDLAADQIAKAIVGSNLMLSRAYTGRVNLLAQEHGLLAIDTLLLNELNQIDEAITVATLPNFEQVVPNQMVATIKVIPFAASKESLLDWEGRTYGQPKTIELRPFQRKRAFLVQTTLPGTTEKILDKTASVLDWRLQELGSSLIGETRCSHEVEAVREQIEHLASDKPDIFLVSGASAITDRRDIIPSALEAAGGTVAQFGMPVDPGNLLMLGNIDKTQVIGIPGCARSPKINGFDWVLQRLCADIAVSGRDIRAMGVGGLLKEIPTRPLPRGHVAEHNRGAVKKSRNIVPLILAAGRSSRMENGNKLLTVFRDRPLILHIMETLASCGMAQPSVVTGHQYRDVEALLADHDVKLIHNPDFADGMSSSLRRGISHMPLDCDGVLVCLGDMPMVSSDTLEKLAVEFDPDEKREICVPVHDGRRGNPVLIGRRFFSELLEIRGDKGARELIRAYPDQVHEVPVQDGGILVDLDDRNAFERLKD